MINKSIIRSYSIPATPDNLLINGLKVWCYFIDYIIGYILLSFSYQIKSPVPYEYVLEDFKSVAVSNIIVCLISVGRPPLQTFV